MDNAPASHIYKCAVDALTSVARADALRRTLREIASPLRIDVNVPQRLIRIVSAEPLDFTQTNSRLAPSGFHLRAIAEADRTPTKSRDAVMRVCIEGMTCRSCEITIERKWRKISGVKKVEVNAASGIARIIQEGPPPTIAQLQSALGMEKYRVRPAHDADTADITGGRRRISFLRLAGLFALVLLLGSLFSKLGLLRPTVSIGSGASFGAIFLLGLVAASSSCIAVAGGLLLSSAAKFNARYGGETMIRRMRPVILFVGGRLLSYAVLGGLIGLVGKALTPSPLVTGTVTILAALYMLIMGLDMLGIAPRALKRIMPRMPKALAHRVLDAERREHPMAPLLLGGATFFLPCGFTQALQLYALTTGNALLSAGLLFAFALGTAPALLALGFASGSLKGKAGKLFFQFSGALVVALGLWNIQNGFAIAGHPLSFPRLFSESTALAGEPRAIAAADPNVTFDGREQTVRMAIEYSGYSPSRFTIRAGIPTRWVIDAKDGGGCLTVLQAPKLGIRKFLNPGLNTIEFTAPNPGVVPFSCSMGMFRGQIEVVPNT